MIPLIAISAFFILGIAFFIIGKNDFGIERVKEVANDTSTIEKVVVNQETTPNNESIEEKEVVTLEPLLENESVDNITD